VSTSFVSSLSRLHLRAFDPECYAILEREIERQSRGIELIPSENYASPAVLEALGTEFTNKYSEGYPGRRYYSGQENTDALESLAIERAKRLFRADHANVQALSGGPDLHGAGAVKTGQVAAVKKDDGPGCALIAVE